MAVPQQLSNYVPGITLAVALGTGAGPIVATLSSVAGLPIIGNFDLRLDDPAPATTYEWVTVTSVNVGASQVTIGTRGQYGTSAIAHPIGTIVGNNISAAMLLAAFPWGTLGYAEVVANQGAITAQADLTGLTVTVTVGTGRRIKITAYTTFTNTAGDSGMAVYIIDSVGPTTVLRDDFSNTTIGNYITSTAICVVTPAAGAHTYKLQAQAFAGTATLQAATDKAMILVEDIGPA